MALSFNATLTNLPTVLSALSSTLASLPSGLNTSSLVSSLDAFASTSPAYSTLTSYEQQTLLSNFTWLSTQTSLLAAALEKVPSGDKDGADEGTLVAMVQLGLGRYDIETWWAPEVFALCIMFFLAVFVKVGLMFMLTNKAVERVRQTGIRSEQALVSRENARSLLNKPARAMLGHVVNLGISTAALILQCLSWRLFILPSMPFRLLDIQYLSLAIKLLCCAYASDLLFGDVHLSIYLHHLFTFGLLLVGQLAAFHTNSPTFFRLATYLLLQATLEQSTYGAMVFYHFYSYLRLQDYAPRAQRKALWGAWALLVFTKFITYPQKVIPVAFAFYWTAMMWFGIDDQMMGRYWLGWSTSLITILLILQVKFCDQIWSLTAHVHHKLHGGASPSRNGPVMSLLFRTFIPSSRRQRQPPLGGGSSGLATPSSNGDGKNFASAAVEPASTVGSMYRNPYEPKEEAIYPGEGRRLANGSVDSEEGHELEQVHALDYNTQRASGATTPSLRPLSITEDFDSTIDLQQGSQYKASGSEVGSSRDVVIEVEKREEEEVRRSKDLDEEEKRA